MTDCLGRPILMGPVWTRCALGDSCIQILSMVVAVRENLCTCASGAFANVRASLATGLRGTLVWVCA